MDKRGWVVAASAYGKRSQLLGDSSLTHAVDWANKRVLCRKVRFASMLDDEFITTELPTCVKCLKKLNNP